MGVSVLRKHHPPRKGERSQQPTTLLVRVEEPPDRTATAVRMAAPARIYAAKADSSAARLGASQGATAGLRTKSNRTGLDSLILAPSNAPKALT